MKPSTRAIRFLLVPELWKRYCVFALWRSGRLALACSLPALRKLKPDHRKTRGNQAVSVGG